MTLSPEPAPTPAPKPRTVKPIPTLTLAKAKSDIKQTMNDDFNRAWSKGTYKAIDRCKRTSRLRINCRQVLFGTVRSGMDGVGYIGRVTVWRTRLGLDYSYRIVGTDYDCQNRGGSRCTKTYRL